MKCGKNKWKHNQRLTISYQKTAWLTLLSQHLTAWHFGHLGHLFTDGVEESFLSTWRIVGEGYEPMMFYQPREPLKVWKDGNHRCKEPLGPKDWWYPTLRFHNWIASSRHACLWWHQSTREHLRVAQIRTTLRGKKSWRDWYFGWGQMVEPFVECRCSTSNLTSTSAYITLRCEVSVGHCMPIKICAGSELQVPIIQVHELGNVIRVAQAAS